MMWLPPKAKLMVALANCGLVLGGCTQFGGDAMSVYELARNAWSGSQTITLKQASAVPYASIGLRLGKSNEILLVLASDDHGRQLWTSAEKIAVVTDKGRVIRTAGLPYNLGESQIRNSNDTAASNNTTASFTWLADFPKMELYAIPVSCRTNAATEETIVILGATIRTRRSEERCKSAQLDWSYTNTFWRDPDTGQIWKSIQYFHPEAPPLTIQTLRPSEKTP